MLWEIFCRVIDNHGDLGVCWRLACNLAVRGESVRLWVDEPGALQWMAPRGHTAVQVMHWLPHTFQVPPTSTGGHCTGDVLVEGFGCEIASEFIAKYVDECSTNQRKPIWINLEYLTAEPYALRAHRLPSPVMTGPGKGLTKHFYYPGFTLHSGGLMREPDLLARQAKFDVRQWHHRMESVSLLGTDPHDGGPPDRLITLFCYEPPGLAEWLDTLAKGPERTGLLVCGGRPHHAVLHAVKNAIEKKKAIHSPWNIDGLLSISYLPYLTQDQFDELLWASDFNCVRGEDSLVRAIWAGKPFVWHIYPQQDAAHVAKLDAFLEATRAPSSLREFHRFWNGIDSVPLTAFDFTAWQEWATATRASQFTQLDLASGLLSFVATLQGTDH